MSRRQARETVLKLEFEYEFQKEKNYFTLTEFLDSADIDDEDKEFINYEYNGIIEHSEELNKIIESHLKSFTLSRIFKMDLAIIKLALFEIMFSKYETPKSVVINEAVELAKKFSTEKSYSFVNGILASVVNGEADGN